MNILLNEKVDKTILQGQINGPVPLHVTLTTVIYLPLFNLYTQLQQTNDFVSYL